jgi:hypothetical protein
MGHSAIIPGNRLKSRTLLHPNVEVLLFGDDATRTALIRAIRTWLDERAYALDRPAPRSA